MALEISAGGFFHIIWPSLCWKIIPAIITMRELPHICKSWWSLVSYRGFIYVTLCNDWRSSLNCLSLAAELNLPQTVMLPKMFLSWAWIFVIHRISWNMCVSMYKEMTLVPLYVLSTSGSKYLFSMVGIWCLLYLNVLFFCAWWLTKNISVLWMTVSAQSQTYKTFTNDLPVLDEGLCWGQNVTFLWRNKAKSFLLQPVQCCPIF